MRSSREKSGGYGIYSHVYLVSDMGEWSELYQGAGRSSVSCSQARGGAWLDWVGLLSVLSLKLGW